MPLTVFLGADDHTDKDGPYSRLIKCRKWIYATSVILVLNYRNLIDYDALNLLVSYIRIPQTLIMSTTLAASIYLISQYTLIFFQLIKTHPALMEERLGARRKEEIEKLSAAIDTEEGALRSRVASLVESARHANVKIFESIEVASKTREEREARLAHLDQFPSNSGKFSMEAAQLRTDIAKLQQEESTNRYIYTNSTDPERLSQDDPHHKAMLLRINELYGRRYNLSVSSPSNIKSYVVAEYIIDALRLGIPWTVGCYTTTVGLIYFFRS